MTQKPERARAFELYDAGWKITDIAWEIKVPERTVYRWIKQRRDGHTFDKKPRKPLVEQVAESTEAIKKPKNLTHLSDDWVSFATNLSVQHFTTSENLRVKLADLLEDTLINEGGNTRKINNLSLAISRCIQDERQAASLEMLNLNRACETLEKHGYLPVRKELLDDK